MEWNTTSILGGVIFGGIGFSAFIYGKKQALWKPMVLGAALMAEPYLVKSPWAVWAAGSALTAALFIFRD